MLVQAIWTVDIGLDSSVVEHLTSDAGVTGSIPAGPASHIFIHTDQLIYIKYTEWDIRCVMVKLM